MGTAGTRRDRAVVLGAGMAGLAAARVLSDHYGEVVVVERDRLPDGVADRPGAAQGRHLHALLARGQMTLEALFPGLTGELQQAGACTGDVLADSRLYFSGHRLHPAASGLTVVSASRALLESTVRSRVRATPGVEMLTGCAASGLLADRQRSTVVGVELTCADDAATARRMEADVVVDATGRSSHAPDWLEALGYARPATDRVRMDVAYSTRRFRMDRGFLGGDVAVINAPTPSSPRAGALSLLEADVGMITLAGICGDRPGLDPDGFTDFARSLAFPDVSDAIAAAEPLDEPVPHRFRASTWHRYDRLRRLPDGFAVMGDGVCSFNPVYGQGVSIAALEAEALGRHLVRHGRLRPRRLQRSLARIVRPAWEIASGADLQFPGVDGRRTRRQKVLGSYVSRLHAAAAHDPELSRAFICVSGLVDPPPALLRPAVAARVMRHATRPRPSAERRPRG